MSVLWFALFLLSYVSLATAEYCKLDTKTCSCIADDGWGVDMRNISGQEIQTAPNFVDNKSGYFLSLCQDSQKLPDYVNGTNECSKGFSVSRQRRRRHIRGIFLTI